MGFSYKPLWKLLIDKDMSKKKFKEITGISQSTIDKMNKGDYVSLEVLNRICNYFGCQLSEIVEHIPDEKW